MSAVSQVGSPDPIRRLLAALERVAPGEPRMPVGRHSSGEGWRLYVMHPKDGLLGPMLDPESGSWEILLNATDILKAKVPKDSLGGLPYHWIYPKIGGLALTWTADGVETPWIAGPIKSWPEEDLESISFDAAGGRDMLADIIVGTDFSRKNVSLGAIASALVDVFKIKPGGSPPYVDGNPDPGGRGHERSYPAWNAANNEIDKLLTELSDVEGGPDMMFRPRFRADDPRFIEWEFVHGTSRSERLPAASIRSFDTTAPEGGIVNVKVKTDASAIVSRVWATGSGEGSGTRIARAESPDLLDAGYTFAEVVISDPGATVDTTDLDQKDPTALAEATRREVARLMETARGEMAARVDAVDQITIETTADHDQHGVGHFYVGDPAAVTLKGWLAIPDGTHRTLIVKASGSFDGDLTVDFQTGTFV